MFVFRSKYMLSLRVSVTEKYNRYATFMYKYMILKQKSETVAENDDTATVALFCDSVDRA